jgi:uncharacterized protein (TIGR04222 family)
MAAVVAVPFGARELIKRVPRRGRDRALDDDELGYLVGGRGRVAEVFIIRLVESGAMRVGREGVLSVASEDEAGACHPGVLGTLSRTEALTVSEVRKRLSSDPRVGQIETALRADGLVEDGWRSTVLRAIAVCLPTALLIAGILRAIEGTGNHRPISLLIFLMVLTVIGIFPLALSSTVGLIRTRRGGRYIAQCASNMRTGVSMTTPRRVALDGFTGVPDPEIRNALLWTPPVTTSSGGCGGCGGGGCGGCGGCGG